MSGLFAVNKPAGSSSAACLDYLKDIFGFSKLFEGSWQAQAREQGGGGRQHGKRGRGGGGGRGKQSFGPPQVKIGHGGTLDPLADGVLIVAVGGGTKQLGQFLNCTKEYEAVALFGCSTDTFDAEGKILERVSCKHVTEELIESKLPLLRGEITQTPPIYSALKMQGKPLYWYARNNQPLPEPIKARSATVAQLEVVEVLREHDWKFPAEEADEDVKLSGKLVADAIAPAADKASAEAIAQSSIENNNDATEEPPAKRQRMQEDKPIAVRLKMTVSGGTYVRSIIHDLGKLCDSAAHMVALTRSRVAEHKIEDAIPWRVFEQGAWEEALRPKLQDITEPAQQDVETEARDFVRRLRPRGLTLTYARSIDGYIADEDRKPLQISCAESMRMTHHLRCAHKQIVVGAGTFRSDDPGLNARDEHGDAYQLDRQPEPWILNASGSLVVGEQSKMWQLHLAGKGKAPVQLVHASTKALAESNRTMATVEAVEPATSAEDTDAGPARLAWTDVCRHIKERRKFMDAMVEGGASVINDLLNNDHAECLDLLVVTVAPEALGKGTAIDVAAEEAKFPVLARRQFGKDTVVVRRRRRQL